MKPVYLRLRPLGVITALLVATTLGVVACHEPPTPPTPPAAAAVELRTYPVSPALAAEVRGVVDRLLQGGDGQPRLGRAALGPGGQLVVAAPASVQAGVEQLVARIASDPPADPAGVELTYWLVEGRPAEAATVPPGLAAVRPALDAITAADGPRAFTLVETLQLRTLAGDTGRVEGRVVRVEQAASVRGGEIVARLDLRHRSGGLETQIALPIDTLLVLGQSGAELPEGDGAPGALYYLVRARVLAPAAK